ncbi:hypothetical protein KOI35_22860 [Actinoplanes bogorensis]|uniref:Uncharacterized protein n=1 Tax=Paractinoplanes bogorensis TaxID=1610840 RepID=A0ABS5YUH1_9ACTN|nr:hypothetical protein [Actinoplanes bogorensis]MBU2666348.1 hypothetical protein [Actinoplanes bogorensis]
MSHYDYGYGKPAPKRSKLPYVLGTVGAVVAFAIGGTAVVRIAGSSGSPVEIVAARPAEVVRTTAPAPAVTEDPVVIIPVNEATPVRTAKTPTPTPTPKKTPTYKGLTSRAWTSIAKNPTAHAGEKIVIYGRIGQYDSRTGSERMLANASNTPYENPAVYPVIFSGDAEMLGAYKVDQMFEAKADVVGWFTFETVKGGTKTVPELRIKSMLRIY